MTILKALGELLVGVIIGIGSIAVVLFFIFCWAIGSVLVGWVAGALVNLIFGSLIVNGLNLILGTALVKANIPVIAAAAGFLGYLLKGSKFDASLFKGKGASANAKK